MRRNRLTDNDTHFGPITIGAASTTWRPIGITLDSGDSEDNPGCSLNLYLHGRTVRLALPAILRPWRQWVDTSKYSWSTNPKGGYWDVHQREYGFRLSEGFLQVFLGPQTHDSITTKSWCTHLPWTEWRYVGMRWYGLDGQLVDSLSQDAERAASKLGLVAGYDLRRAVEERVPTVRFAFKDFDGQDITVTTRIEEREWHFGEGWFKWLSWFKKPRISRSLDLEFSSEVGREKGSWKGGTMGHSIEMLPGELHEAAFRRYCQAGMRSKHGTSPMTFVGRAEAKPEEVAA